MRLTRRVRGRCRTGLLIVIGRSSRISRTTRRPVDTTMTGVAHVLLAATQCTISETRARSSARRTCQCQSALRRANSRRSALQPVRSGTSRRTVLFFLSALSYSPFRETFGIHHERAPKAFGFRRVRIIGQNFIEIVIAQNSAPG
jgi:hypothetical protein